MMSYLRLLEWIKLCLVFCIDRVYYKPEVMYSTLYTVLKS